MKVKRDLIFDPPDIGTVLYLPGLPGGGSKIFDRSPYGNNGTIVGATWARNAQGVWELSFGTTDEVETPALGLTDADDYTICEWFEDHFRVLVNEGGVGKTYYLDGVDITPATFTPTYSISTNKILEAVE